MSINISISCDSTGGSCVCRSNCVCVFVCVCVGQTLCVCVGQMMKDYVVFF